MPAFTAPNAQLVGENVNAVKKNKLYASKGVGLAVNTKRDEENVYKTVYKMMLTKKIRAD